jgi:hypothetical protein
MYAQTYPTTVNELFFSSHGSLRYDALEALVPAASVEPFPDLPHVLANKRASELLLAHRIDVCLRRAHGCPFLPGGLQ